MIKLAVFDIAGTTLQDNNYVNDAFVETFNQFDLFPTKDQIDSVMGQSKPVAIDITLKKLNSTLSAFELHQIFLNKMLSFYDNSENVKEIIGATKTFEKLHNKGIKVALDTGFSQDITNLILKHTKWLSNKLIDTVVSSDQVSLGRPFPYMIFKIMEKFSIENVKEIIKVGDTLVDMQEGINAGCSNIIAVTSGTCNQLQFNQFIDNYIKFNTHDSKFYIFPDINFVPQMNL